MPYVAPKQAKVHAEEESLKSLIDRNDEPRALDKTQSDSAVPVSDLLGALASLKMPPNGVSSEKGALLQDTDYETQTRLPKKGGEEPKSLKAIIASDTQNRAFSSQVSHPKYSHEEQLAQQVLETHTIVQPKESKKDAVAEDKQAAVQVAPEIESELLKTILERKESVPRAPPKKEDEEGFFVESPKSTSPTTTLEELPSQLKIQVQHQPSERMELHVAYECLELMQEANLQVEFGRTLNDESDCAQCLRTSPHLEATNKTRTAPKKPTAESFQQKVQQVARMLVGLLQGNNNTNTSSFMKKCWICASPSCASHNIYHTSSPHQTLPDESDICLCHECSTLLNPKGIFNSRRQRHYIQSLLVLYDGVWLILEYLTENNIIEDIARRLVRLGDDPASLLAANRVLVLYSVAHSIIDVVNQCAAPLSTNTPSLLVVDAIPYLLAAEARDRELIMSQLVHDTASADKAKLLERMQMEILLEGLPETDYLAQKAEAKPPNHH